MYILFFILVTLLSGCSTIWKAADAVIEMKYDIQQIKVTQKLQANQIASVMYTTAKNQGVEKRVIHVEEQNQILTYKVDGLRRDFYVIKRQLKGGGNPRFKKDFKRKVSYSFNIGNLNAPIVNL